MNPILNKNLFFVKEHFKIFKAANNFDIYDPATNQIILECREDNLSLFTKLFRFSDAKRKTPFDIEIRTPQGTKILSIKRGWSFWLSKVEVLDENDRIIGYFKQKFFTIGGKFDVLDPYEQVLCTLQGKWTSWEFKFIKDSYEYATVSKKWAGIGKELFTTSDNYMLKIEESVPLNSPLRQLILAAVMCIDMVLKE
jgi:uncharacterized protein YxjI